MGYTESFVKGAAQGGAAGMATGNPVFAAVGAGLGGISGLMGARSAKQAEERQQKNIQQELELRRQEAARIRAMYADYVKNAGMAPGERERRMELIRTGIARNLAQTNYGINTTAGSRNLGRSSVPIQSATRTGVLANEDFAKSQLALEAQDRAARQHARLASIGGEYASNAGVRTMFQPQQSLYGEQKSAGRDQASAGMEMFAKYGAPAINGLYNKNKSIGGTNSKSIERIS